jgi:hypothetical protein
VGITSFAGGKSVGFYGSEEQKRRHLPSQSLQGFPAGDSMSS